jgi:flagellar biosynthetic protein FliO
VTSEGAVPDGYGELLVSSLVVLVLVCVVAWLVVRFGGRWLLGARGRSRGMDVIARLPLEPRRSLYVVEVAGKTLLVGTSEMGLSVLSELDGERVRADVEKGRGAGGFAAAMRAVLRRPRPPGGDSP